ncbi:hypothetical protein B5F44_14330 [Gordonibacter urolithinfaciens]|nr:hypothetical protein B5F44_14330 [Gordonibacter urolithinfaciens]
MPGKRVPRQAAVARLGPSWKRVVGPAGRPGGGIPKGRPLGAGPGRREPRSHVGANRGAACAEKSLRGVRKDGGVAKAGTRRAKGRR